MDNEQAIGSTDLVVSVEMGDDFEPGSRTAAALNELADALNEEHGDEVSGFEYQKPAALRSFSFVSAPEPNRNFFEAWPAKWKVSDFDGKTTS